MEKGTREVTRIFKPTPKTELYFCRLFVQEGFNHTVWMESAKGCLHGIGERLLAWHRYKAAWMVSTKGCLDGVDKRLLAWCQQKAACMVSANGCLHGVGKRLLAWCQ